MFVSAAALWFVRGAVDMEKKDEGESEVMEAQR